MLAQLAISCSTYNVYHYPKYYDRSYMSHHIGIDVAFLILCLLVFYLLMKKTIKLSRTFLIRRYLKITRERLKVNFKIKAQKTPNLFKIRGSVPGVGIEPTLQRNASLSRARLPIPPSGQGGRQI